jgi:hypothetical protein
MYKKNYGDMELQGINMNITGRDEHIPEVENNLGWSKKEQEQLSIHNLSKYCPTDFSSK